MANFLKLEWEKKPSSLILSFPSPSVVKSSVLNVVCRSCNGLAVLSQEDFVSFRVAHISSSGSWLFVLAENATRPVTPLREVNDLENDDLKLLDR